MTKRNKPYLLHASFRPEAEIDYDTYPFNIPAVRDLHRIAFHPNVTFFVGENGSGKSTVMEGLALALGFGAEGGTKNVQMKTADSTSPLHEALRLARGVPKPRDGYFLRAESFFNVATYMDETGYLGGLRWSLSAPAVSRGDAMDASLPTGKELRPLNAKSMNSRLSGRETSSNRGGSSDGYGIKVPMA